MPFSSLNFLAVAASAILALALTPLVRTVARRYGMVAKPKTDRWHKHPRQCSAAWRYGWRWLSVTSCSFDLILPQGFGHFPGSFLDVVMGASTFLFLVAWRMISYHQAIPETHRTGDGLSLCDLLRSDVALDQLLGPERRPDYLLADRNHECG